MRLPLWVMRWMHRRNISRKKIRGTFLHNWLGDRLLAKELWLPTRESLARAWLVGWPITVVPLLPGQSLIASVAALMVRGNVLLCVALQFLSTPFTAPIHLPACYFVGEIVRGNSPSVVWHTTIKVARSDPLKLVSGHNAASLYIGAFVVGVVGGLIGYAVIHGLWRDRPKPKRNTRPGLPPAAGKASD